MPRRSSVVAREHTARVEALSNRGFTFRESIQTNETEPEA